MHTYAQHSNSNLYVSSRKFNQHAFLSKFCKPCHRLKCWNQYDFAKKKNMKKMSNSETNQITIPIKHVTEWNCLITIMKQGCMMLGSGYQGFPWQGIRAWGGWLVRRCMIVCIYSCLWVLVHLFFKISGWESIHSADFKLSRSNW